MKRVLVVLCALVFITACSSQRSLSQRSKDPKMMAYVWENGRPENASIDWNRPWSTDQQYAQGGVGAGAQGSVSRGSGGVETMDQADIELRKEELVVGKREVSNGGVIVRTVVHTENVSQPVDLRREEYVIERVPANEARDRDTASQAASYTFQDKEIYIPLMREEPVTSKRVLLTERVHVGKKAETDRQTITRPVRKEDIEIVKNPDLSDRRFSNVNRLPSASFGREDTAKGGTSAAPQGGAERMTGRDTADLELAKEEFIVGKRDIENGGVLLKKVVHTQEASQPIELKREEFAIDRSPIRDQEARNTDFREREIQINLTREEPVVGTRSFATEFVRLRKKVETDHQNVAGTVRREELQIVKNGEQTDRRVSSVKSSDEVGQGGTAGQSNSSTLSESSKRSKNPENGKDLAISDRVHTALANGSAGSSDKATTADYSNIDISTHNGVVTLRGTVGSEKEKRRIAQCIGEISGVRSVKNELKVAGE